MVAGSLAEGERRTGWLPPELIRCYWHQWETEVQPVFTTFCDRRSSPWGLPPTASDEERLLMTVKTIAHAQSPPEKLPQKTAMVIANDPAMRELLSDWGTQRGFKFAEAEEEPRDVAEILLDVASEDFAETVATVQRLKQHYPSPKRLTVFYNSPRADEAQQLIQAGANRIVAKPFFLPW
jgi:CheY-like chemotaxis protein